MGLELSISFSPVVVLRSQKLLHLFEIVVLDVAEAWRAVCFSAVDAGVTIFKSCNHLFTLKTLTSSRLRILHYHTHVIRLARVTMFLDALVFGAKPKTFFLSLMKDELVGELVNQLHIHVL